jgi:aryl-alcohol dehydrogenase-like predicted oxidoreductase
MEFVHAAKTQGLPKIVSIQNSYSLIVRCRFEGEKISLIHSFYSLSSLSYAIISEIVSELLRISFDFSYK